MKSASAIEKPDSDSQQAMEERRSAAAHRSRRYRERKKWKKLQEASPAQSPASEKAELERAIEQRKIAAARSKAYRERKKLKMQGTPLVRPPASEKTELERATEQRKIAAARSKAYRERKKLKMQGASVARPPASEKTELERTTELRKVAAARSKAYRERKKLKMQGALLAQLHTFGETDENRQRAVEQRKVVAAERSKAYRERKKSKMQGASLALTCTFEKADEDKQRAVEVCRIVHAAQWEKAKCERKQLQLQQFTLMQPSTSESASEWAEAELRRVLEERRAAARRSRAYRERKRLKLMDAASVRPPTLSEDCSGALRFVSRPKRRWNCTFAVKEEPEEVLSMPSLMVNTSTIKKEPPESADSQVEDEDSCSESLDPLAFLQVQLEESWVGGPPPVTKDEILPTSAVDSRCTDDSGDMSPSLQHWGRYWKDCMVKKELDDEDGSLTCEGLESGESHTLSTSHKPASEAQAANTFVKQACYNQACCV
ncbi:calponin homology domain-containing protein DDB_G0272472 isoform X2 [Ixodes scapularis]|uniref:calponin homology domain-containing protein DDB_G0272472 isoform X2 n=1 Tax=Ixodes scapularis TaxID=6945 RepID=UPI001A9F24C8|nr:calponin homology domain-containing protein DDB_G0272472 isoform X2 [Ixodes scapularis]